MLFPFQHVALLVEDLDAAVLEYERKLDIPFTEISVAHVEDFREADGASRAIDIRVACSTNPDSYYELIQVQESGFYGREMGLGIHHVGVFEQDCEKRLNDLISRGFELEAIQYTPEGRIIVAYFSPNALLGTRMEIVDEGRRPMMEAWMRGGEFVD